MQVFLSYARPDRAWVSRLADELKGRGLHIWLDSAELKPGDRLDEALRTAIDEADACLVIVSEGSDATEPRLSKEWTTIQELSWARPDLRIYPIQVGDAEIPPFLRKWQALRIPRAVRGIGAAADLIVALLREAPRPAAEADKARDRAALAARFAELERFVEHMKAMEQDDGRTVSNG